VKRERLERKTRAILVDANLVTSRSPANLESRSATARYPAKTSVPRLPPFHCARLVNSVIATLARIADIVFQEHHASMSAATRVDK